MVDIRLSTKPQHVINNLLRIHSYSTGTAEERRFHFNRVYNAEHQVYYHTPDGALFAPVKWCGARDNSINDYSVNKDPVTQVFQRALRNIGFIELHEGDESYDQVYSNFLAYCRSFGFKPSPAGSPHSHSGPRIFWALGFAKRQRTVFPDEVLTDTALYEGAIKKVSVNAFERSSAARLSCIAHYGWSCQACGMNFEQRYGELGSEFIHVHHTRPLSTLREEHQVDPVIDLRPVCPNCHARIHRRDPPLTVEELAALISAD